MTSAEVALIAAICISPVLDVPSAKGTIAMKIPMQCVELTKTPAPAVQAAAVPVKPVRVVKRKNRLAARADKCGSMRAVWYTKPNGHRKYRCR